MLRKSFLVFLIIVLLIGTAAVSAEENATSEKTFTDIQDAIDQAEENDTIELEGTYVSEGKDIKINKSITISSKTHATLNAKSKSNIFTVSNVTVTFKNLDFINSQTMMASAIKSDGDVNIIDSNFNRNYVRDTESAHIPEDFDYIDPSAGSVFTTKNLYISNSTFANSDATCRAWEYEYFYYYMTSWGGAVFAKGNIVIDKSRFSSDIESRKNITITNSEFEKATVTSKGESTIINTTFKNNGEYAALSVSSNALIDGCNFTGNAGNCIYCYDYSDNPHTVTILNSNFKNNNLKSAGCYDYSAGDDVFNIEVTAVEVSYANLYIRDCLFENNSGIYGGAVSCSFANATIINSAFIKNTADDSYDVGIGGAVYADNVTLINSTFEENCARTAGAIMSDYLKAVNSTFSKNTATYIGAVFTTYGEIINCTVMNNQEGAIYASKSIRIGNETFSKLTTLSNDIKPIKLISVTMPKLTTYYKSGKTLNIKFTYTESGNALKNDYIDFDVYKGKTYYSEWGFTNSYGILKVKASNYNVGTYKLIYTDPLNENVKYTTTFKITKAKTTVKAPKVTAKYKKTKYFKITVKSYKKPIKGLVLKLKIGKKTYKVKTNSKGVAKFNTKKLKKGRYTVKITTTNGNYKLSAKSKITIRK